MVWFLTTGNGGAKARPRKVIRAFMYQVRRCQRAAREWLACRAARFVVVVVVVAKMMFCLGWFAEGMNAKSCDTTGRSLTPCENEVSADSY